MSISGHCSAVEQGCQYPLTVNCLHKCISNKFRCFKVYSVSVSTSDLFFKTVMNTGTSNSFYTLILNL